jgi:hypothetical protein
VVSDLLFGLIAGSGLTWVFMELRRDGYWREFNARRRGSNPPPPARPPEQPLTAQLIRYWRWHADQVARAWADPRPGDSWPEDYGPGPPAPGMRREWIWSPLLMAGCAGPCRPAGLRHRRPSGRRT